MTTGSATRHRPERVRVSFVDLHGRCRSKELLATDPTVQTGVSFCAMALAESPRGHPLDSASPASATYGDLVAHPDPATERRVPWDPGTTWMLADVDAPSCPRRALRRASATLAGLGLVASVGLELELLVVHRDGQGSTRPATPAHEVAYLTRPGELDTALRALRVAADELELRPTTASRECGRGQIELNLDHGPALDAADRVVLLREAARQVLADHGLGVSFLALAFDDCQPSGMHLHLSLRRSRDGDDRPDPTALRHATAGILAHAPALTAIASPTINSYRRLAVGGLVPVAANWGPDDRRAYVRVLEDRIEVRCGDALANPHLLTAAVLLAAADGITSELDPGSPRTETPGPPLPRTLDDAVDALAGDDVLRDGLGPELVQAFVAVKRDECARARLHVSAWEREEYAALAE